jgi:hypothetical protein
MNKFNLGDKVKIKGVFIVEKIRSKNNETLYTIIQ